MGKERIELALGTEAVGRDWTLVYKGITDLFEGHAHNSSRLLSPQNPRMPFRQCVIRKQIPPLELTIRITDSLSGEPPTVLSSGRKISTADLEVAKVDHSTQQQTQQP